MSTARQELGELGEQVAERWLRRQGWRVLARRFRSGHRDLDLVVWREGEGGDEDGGTIAFVEVKTRRGAGFGGPIAAVGWRKQRELTRSAQVWMDRHGAPPEIGRVATFRFDVVGVLIRDDGRIGVLHVRDAFPAHARR